LGRPGGSPHTMKLVILDRDGTINVDSDEFIKTPAEWIPLPGALEAISRLNHAGWRVAVASNQSGLGRGLFDVASLNAIHAKMHKALGAVGGRIDAVFYCPHSPDEGCQCRKPLPGLFEQIGERFGVDLKTAHVVGDTPRDLLAGAAVGCQPHLVLTGNAESLRASFDGAQDASLLPPDTYPPHTTVHKDLGAFADWLLAKVPAPRPA
jgi:D-glycero-D-manno-heptose 1,7-bisphosphate phosphatase